MPLRDWSFSRNYRKRNQHLTNQTFMWAISVCVRKVTVTKTTLFRITAITANMHSWMKMPCLACKRHFQSIMYFLSLREQMENYCTMKWPLSWTACFYVGIIMNYVKALHNHLWVRAVSVCKSVSRCKWELNRGIKLWPQAHPSPLDSETSTWRKKKNACKILTNRGKITGALLYISATCGNS